jgi:glycosyltransferase involved in cell wall biosynthesis
MTAINSTRAFDSTDSRWHVMQVTFGMVIGGLERVVMELCRQIDPSRYRLSICCLGTRGPLSDVMEREGINVIVCERQDKLSKYLRGFELARLLKSQRVDLVHAHHTPALVDSALATKLAGVPLIATDHCKLYPTSTRWRVLENVASRFADTVVAVSEHSKADLIRYQGLNPGSLEVIYNGLDLQTPNGLNASELRAQLGLRPDDVIIGTAARLESQKGLELLISAAKLVVAKAPKTRFVIVGGGTEEPKLRQMVRDMSLDDHVIITGFRIDAVMIMSLMDCFVQTSHWEGMPMALLEAMALAKPVVATAVGGVPEVVVDGQTGLLLHNRDAGQLAEALLTIRGRPEMASGMGAAGRERYQQLFTSRAMIAQYERLYGAILKRRRKTQPAALLVGSPPPRSLDSLEQLRSCVRL